MPMSKKTAQAVAPPLPPGSAPYWRSECGRAVVYVGDCREVMAQMEPEQFHAVVTDPPYEFIPSGTGRYHIRAARKDGGGVPNTGAWDSTGVAFDLRTWGAALHVAKPGAHMLSFGGTRVFHHMVCAIEDSGWDIRDMLMWLYSSGYPKGLDISKEIDCQMGASGLRPVVGLQVMPDTTRVRAGFTGRAHGGECGAVREVELTTAATDEAKEWEGWNTTLRPAWEPVVMSRRPLRGNVTRNIMDHGCGGVNVGACRVGENKLWPANVIHDGDKQLSRWFYAAKVSADPDGNRPHGNGAVAHPTVKPLDLMRYLARLVCARGGRVLDPFMGSGSTGCAAIEEGMWFVGIELSQEYADIAVGRLKLSLARSPTGSRLMAASAPRTTDVPPTPVKIR